MKKLSHVEKTAAEKFASAMKIAETYDVTTQADSLVLYSVSFLNSQKNKNAALDFIEKNPGKVLVEDTICGKKLIEEGLMTLDCGLERKEVDEIWKTAMKRVIAAASGGVWIFADNADIRGRLLDVGIKAIIENPDIETINGIDKDEYAVDVISW